MIERKDILKMVRHVTKRSRGVPDKKLIHPRREWLIGLVLFIVVLAGGLTYNSFSYQKALTVGSEESEGTTGVVQYRTGLVEDALTIYRERKLRFEELRPEATAPAMQTPQNPIEDGLVEGSEDTDVQQQIEENFEESPVEDVVVEEEGEEVAEESVGTTEDEAVPQEVSEEISDS